MKGKQNTKPDLKMLAILPVDFAFKSKANNRKSQEFSVWETVIFLLLKQQFCLVENKDKGVL